MLFLSSEHEMFGKTREVCQDLARVNLKIESILAIKSYPCSVNFNFVL